jgi:hypothetical protein
MRIISNHHGEVTYLNSGDCVENMSALECKNGKWEIYRSQKDDFAKTFAAAEKH